AVAELQTAGPGIAEPGIQIRRAAADQEVVVGLAGVTAPGRRIVATEGIVGFGAAALVQHADADFQRLAELMAEAGSDRAVAVAVVVRVAGVGRAGAIKALGFFLRGAETEAGALVAAGKAGAVLPGTIAAAGDAQARLQSEALAAAGEDLHHAAKGVGSVEGGTRAAQHLDALDLVDRQILQAGAAGGGRADPHAVDQNHALRGAGAADVEPVEAAAAAVVGDLHAGRVSEQLEHAGRTQALDVLAGEHGHRAAHVVPGLGLAVGGDDGAGQLQGLVARG